MRAMVSAIMPPLYDAPSRRPSSTARVEAVRTRTQTAVLLLAQGLESPSFSGPAAKKMNLELAIPLGLVETPLFAKGAPEGDHLLCLDGVNGSFGLSRVTAWEPDLDTRSWAWSSGVLHHVTATPDQVVLTRWDHPDPVRYTLSSVTQRVDKFYERIAESHASTNQTIATHALDSFRRLRSSFSVDRQFDALSAFLLILAGMVESLDMSVLDRSEEIANQFDLDGGANTAVKNLSPELIRHFIAGFRRPLFAHTKRIETIPSLMVRHAGAMVFQEAHFELMQRGSSDMFGVPDAATLGHNSGSGVHFTPPGLARAIVEQALDAYGLLPDSVTILDAACGSGSILHEAIRTLHDRKYQGSVRIFGFDESRYAIEMTRFVLSAFRHDWPNFKIAEIVIHCRNSLNDEPWPAADFILMNPPFVSVRNLTPDQRINLTNVLGKYARGRPDLSMAFIERGLRGLAPNGVMGTLMPAGILSMTYAQEWRRHLLDEASISFLALFSELNLFRLATVETGCVVLRKTPDDGQSMYRSLWVSERKKATPEALRSLRRATQQLSANAETDNWTLDQVPSRLLRTAANWRPTPNAMKRDLEQIERNVTTTVNSFFEVKQGAIPAPREAFIIKAAQWKELSSNDERRWFRRVAENQNIRGGKLVPGPYIFYPRSEGLPPLNSEEDLDKHLPTFVLHLLNYKTALLKRPSKREHWWDLARDRTWLRAPSKKIISSYFGQAGSFAFDSDGDRIVVQGYGWISRWPASLSVDADMVFNAYAAMFNSLFFNELLSEICPTIGGGQLNLSKRYSEKVPLPNLLARIESSSGMDSIVRELYFIGDIIEEKGLPAAPRAKLENLVRTLYGL
jgi:adenine-specific DNA-methyltransferase